MSDRDSRRVIIATAVCFLFLEIAAVCLFRSSASLQGAWLSRMSFRCNTAIWGWSGGVSNFFSLRSRNDELALENHELRLELDSLRRALPKEFLQGVKPGKSEYTYIPATIVKIGRGRQHNYFIINKGSVDGVRPHSGIITGKGVVGIIDAVDKHYSYGLSFMNPKVAVSARIGRAGVIGPLYWDGKGQHGAVMKNLQSDVQVARGDTVWTSGFSPVFPEDIALGITQKSRLVDGATTEISVDLFQDFSSLRYVTVTVNQSGSEVAELEKKEVAR